jgi:hypothetical protein
MDRLPQDPIMLMSFINLKLRDFYPSLEALCEDLDINRQELVEKMLKAGFEYSETNKRFW